MDALESQPELSADDTPVASIHHRQHPWDVNFFNKIRGMTVRMPASLHSHCVLSHFTHTVCYRATE